MALDRAELLRLARMGAGARLETLEAERTALLRHFPDLGTTSRRAASGPRRRRRLSAAARKRISDMMKKRWAARKKAAVSAKA